MGKHDISFGGGAPRDPARISRILEKLEKYWKTCPDMRLGQIIVNFTPIEFAGEMDPFHLEDDRLEKSLDIVLDLL